MFLFLFLLIYEDFIYFFQVPKEWVLDPGWDEEDGFNEKEDFKRSKVLGFVGIQTSYTSIELRKAIRETWLASDPEGILRCYLCHQYIHNIL